MENAFYPEIWSRKGYPARFNLNAAIGQIAHGALAMIVRALMEAGCPDILDGKAVNTLKCIGGYKAVIASSIEAILAEQSKNPRSEFIIDLIARLLFERSEEIRERVQRLLSRTKLGKASLPALSRANSQNSLRLGFGSYSEVAMEAASIDWVGKADLVNISAEYCEIVDFKTGKQEEHHIRQMLTYAVLWALDRKRNPGGRLATKLTLVYPHCEMDIKGLNEREIAAHAALLKGSAQEAKDLTANMP